MPYQTSILDEIQEHESQNLQNWNKGFTCPKCGSYCKQYTRRFNSNMSRALIELCKLNTREYVHLENLMRSKGYKRCGDASFLQHYRFIEQMPEVRKDGSKRTGMYRITINGILFVEGKSTVAAKFILKNNKLVAFTGPNVLISDTLGEAFDYSKLMNND